MGKQFQAFLFVIIAQIWFIAGETDPGDAAVLFSIKASWQNLPPNWIGSDPCGSGWVGINCTNSRVTSMNLQGMNVMGTEFGDIPSLSELQHLILVGCSFFGPIPESIGSLQNLVYLALNDNRFNGPIPNSIGNLSKLNRLDLNDNKLNGSIPVSNANVSGLDMLVNTQHLRLDSNFLNGFVPANLNNLTNLTQLYLSNNNLIGSVPNLTGMNSLFYVLMERTQLEGGIPVDLFNSTNLVTVLLSNNQLSGSLNLSASNSNQLGLLDLQNNSITTLELGTGNDMELKLAGNPICDRIQGTESYCGVQKTNPSYITSANNCTPTVCQSDEILSPLCKCAIPYTGTLHFIYFSFSKYNSSYISYLSGFLMNAFRENLLPVDSILLSNPTFDTYFFRQFTLNLFPSGQDNFNRTGISAIGTLLNRQPPQVISYFGPFYFTDESYPLFGEVKSSSKTGIIIGAAVSSSVLVLLLLCVSVYALQQRRRITRALAHNTSASLNHEMRSDSFPRLKGARCFSFEELKKCTDNFSESKLIGSGGYGKVYRGTLDTGQLVAIKRAQLGSLQGANEFKTEIELLSRIHHKNVVGLVGFCHSKGEQMLIYEYIPNGTLIDSLSGKSGIRMDWMSRLRVALDAARGLAYLHELANPPIIHRDVKPSNILLDDNLSAKVADFGISKPISDTGKSYITTEVKGTTGYVDPEYYMTKQLTQKSDVYSFGIVLLELITGRKPIERGKNILWEVKEAMDNASDPSELLEILDPAMGWGTSLVCLEMFLDLAMSCVGEISRSRPKMGEVVREIENIIQEAGSNLNSEFVEFNLSSFEEKIDGYDSSVSFVPFRVEGH
ncbi:hypothetical protein RHMOL_Rhmol11G0174900 [Rhododendron molle]|uniref:Uncharacterized protein n=1 Tax=Rhododendron molle TaxID=49168 RepID=A0ACC0LT99_RHOML|nr:hypothetical protein RHMOL_Rhmol11G0174900 [Rhododendron molle]